MNEPEAARRARIAAESRLLYALLDATDSLERIRDQSLLRRWKELKDTLVRSTYEQESAALFQLMAAIHASGALEGTWLKARWQLLERRVANPREARDSRAPW